jgi:rod shape-determining protein MreB
VRKVLDVGQKAKQMLGRTPESIVLGPKDIAEALEDPVEELAGFVQRTLEDLPPEVSTDICERGIHSTGGGAVLDRLDR